MDTDTRGVRRTRKPSKESGVSPDSSVGSTSGELSPAASVASLRNFPPGGGKSGGDSNNRGQFDIFGGGASSPEAESDSEITVEAPQTVTPPKTRRTRRVKPKAAKVSAAEGSESAAAAIQTVELFAVARFGEAAKFSDEERLLIEPSLAKLIEQYGGAVERFGGLLSVIPLAAGVISYVNRLNKIAIEWEQKSAPGGAPPPPPPPEPSTDGNNLGIVGDLRPFNWDGRLP